MMPGSRVQTPAEAQSEPWPTCGCGCGAPVAQRGGKPGRWAGDGCRQRYWNATHHSLDLGGLPVAGAERAKKMADEAVRAAREGLKRATVDVLPVKHQIDPRPSCRVRVSEDVWDDLDFLKVFLGLPCRSAVVEALVEAATRWVVALAGGDDGAE